jgi:hypothetical protein
MTYQEITNSNTYFKKILYNLGSYLNFAYDPYYGDVRIINHTSDIELSTFSKRF